MSIAINGGPWMTCKVLKVSRSSYYYGLKYPIGKRSQQIKEMEDRIQAVYFKAKGRYGSPRIREELCKSGTDVSLPTVAKYMKRMGLKSKYSRKYKPTTAPIGDNDTQEMTVIKGGGVNECQK